MQDMHPSSSSTAPTLKGESRPRPLPNLPIPGDIVYFLDDLLEFAARELGRDPKEVMADVVSRGLASFVASIPEGEQKRLGLDATRFSSVSMSPGEATCPPGPRAAGDDALANLEKLKSRIESQLQEERKKSRQLAETIRELKLELEEHEGELQPQSLSNGAHESTYTELTHHAFSEKKPFQPEQKTKHTQAPAKKSNKRKRHKGSPPWGKAGAPRNNR